ncbi:fibrinogen-like YCDxxxxGGGW domain-containing protein [Pseudoalteromonas sp. MMG012]|uniref:fibrinogen-like YCDxxxxGGGW domain-containing protein n=1 Tax=Pseudoalteromonas sp. MMG012 TaxID=2822686 RepID=UPI001B3A1C3C|nr:fibrinogen-like YCDxxxxGGGW domain-containing protein [Pseudoalteromonas sp. MMG012]MBQ4852971.1 hypothetical protein [Pseudoalteromonas sp. MMG012]
MFKKTLLNLAVLSSLSLQAFELQEHTINEQGVIKNQLDSQVVIAGVASFNETDPGVVSVKDNLDGTVTIRFSEWEYLDGAHANETASSLTLSKGRHELLDGSIWEVGSVELGTTSQTIAFTQKMPQTPYLFLSAQSENGVFPYVGRVSNVTQLDFDAQIQYQELKQEANTQMSQTLAYLAVYAPNKEGELDSGVKYKIDQIYADHNVAKFNTHELFLEEEQSKDTETTHISEVVNILDVEGHLFAQSITKRGNDTVSIRANKHVHPEPAPVSCKEIQVNDASAASGFYKLDVDGVGNMPEFTTYCDMETKGGGWTLMGIRYVTTVNYSGYPDITNYFVEVNNITNFDDNYHLSDAQWVKYKNVQQELMVISPSTGGYAIADIAVLNTANCMPLQDTLGEAPNQSGEHRLKLYWHEASGCTTTGTDYTMYNYQNIYAYIGGMYKDTNITSLVGNQTTHVFVR